MRLLCDSHATVGCDCCATACDCHTTVLSVVDGHDRGPLRQSCDCRVLFCATVLLLSYDCRATVTRPFCCCLTTIVTLSCDCHTTVVRQSWQQSWRVVASRGDSRDDSRGDGRVQSRELGCAATATGTRRSCAVEQPPATLARRRKYRRRRRSSPSAVGHCSTSSRQRA